MWVFFKEQYTVGINILKVTWLLDFKLQPWVLISREHYHQESYSTVTAVIAVRIVMNWAKPGQRVMFLWPRQLTIPVLHAECLGFWHQSEVCTTPPDTLPFWNITYIVLCFLMNILFGENLENAETCNEGILNFLISPEIANANIFVCFLSFIFAF